MKAGYFQFNPVFGEKERNLRHVNLALSSIHADLIVLPEFFATGYQFAASDEVADLAESVPNGKTTEFLVDLSEKTGCYLVAGLPERDGDSFYNSAVMTGPSGFQCLYRKSHLFFEETLYFKPGNSGFVVQKTPFGKVGIMICFDWLFPESMRTLALRGADIVAHPANLVLPFCPDSMPLRCLENRVFAVTANRTGTEDRSDSGALRFIGKSQIVSPGAGILMRAPDEEDHLGIVEIDIADAQSKAINRYNDLFRDRRPDLYSIS